MSNTNNWILTDDDAQQYVKEISTEEIPHTFKLIEMCLFSRNPDEYEVYTDAICVDDYLETMRGELKEILHSYSYYLDDEDEEDENERSTSIWNYKEEAYQIMAECIFEYYGAFQTNERFIGSYQECCNFIQKWITEN